MTKGKADKKPVAVMDTAAKRFGALLRKERDHAGLSQRELARRINRTSATVIGNLEDGLNQPNIETLALLGKVFQWDFNRIMSIFGAPVVAGMEKIGSTISARPELQRLFAFSRELPNDDLKTLAMLAEGMRDRIK